jgi:S1-C subfamily serine protease
MTPIRLVAALIAATMTIGVSGCGRVTETIDRITRAAEAGPPMPLDRVQPPDAALANEAVVADAAHSVVKVSSTAQACAKIMEGSGFVVAPNRVMTNAHVVAGAESFTVSVGGREHEGRVVAFDPNTDVSILDVPGLQATPLDFARGIAVTGTDAVVLGYPGGGPFVANPARIREVIELNGPDIYKTTTVKREVYTIRGKVGQGDSGGPLIGRDGRVLGMNFGAAVDDPETGFVLTTKQVYPLAVNSGATEPVPTGACVTCRFSGRASAEPTPTAESRRRRRTRRTACRSLCRSRRARSWSRRGFRSTRRLEPGARARPDRCS